MSMSRRSIPFIVLVLWGMALDPGLAQAMSVEQVKKLAGATLLDLRVDALFRQCGLPAAIVDSAQASSPRQTARWGDVEMKLSALQWEIRYRRQHESTASNSGWSNPALAGDTCLTGLAGLDLHAKGEAGVLTVKKRADNQGYLTSYTIPDNLYAAHQIVALTGIWMQGTPIPEIEKLYGVPDEVLNRAGGIRIHRYWVVERKEQVPVTVQAVDFQIKGRDAVCHQYTIHTRGADFVQEKFDTLWREWEKHHVLD